MITRTCCGACRRSVAHGMSAGQRARPGGRKADDRATAYGQRARGTRPHWERLVDSSAPSAQARIAAEQLTCASRQPVIDSGRLSGNVAPQRSEGLPDDARTAPRPATIARATVRLGLLLAFGATFHLA